MRVHVGDQELMRLIRRHCGDCLYPNANIGPRQKELYENWPPKVGRQSASWHYLYVCVVPSQAGA